MLTQIAAPARVRNWHTAPFAKPPGRFLRAQSPREFPLASGPVPWRLARVANACASRAQPRALREGAAQKLGKGKTPVLTAEEAGDLLRSIETDDLVGLRDRALIGVMVFTFAGVSEIVKRAAG